MPHWVRFWCKISGPRFGTAINVAGSFIGYNIDYDI
jgi:hypothetical protein